MTCKNSLINLLRSVSEILIDTKFYDGNYKCFESTQKVHLVDGSKKMRSSGNRQRISKSLINDRETSNWTENYARAFEVICHAKHELVQEISDDHKVKAFLSHHFPYFFVLQCCISDTVHQWSQPRKNVDETFLCWVACNFLQKFLVFFTVWHDNIAIIFHFSSKWVLTDKSHIMAFFSQGYRKGMKR